MSDDERAEVAALRAILTQQDVEFSEDGDVFHLELPGVSKLKTPVRLEVGPHSLIADAFVCRRPDENFEAVYRWLLERNARMFAFAFSGTTTQPSFTVGRGGGCCGGSCGCSH